VVAQRNACGADSQPQETCTDNPATLAGYQAAVNWLNEMIGSTVLADIKNEVAKQLVIKMKAAELADKTVVNYFQVVKAVVASPCRAKASNSIPAMEFPFHRPSGHRREKTTQSFFDCSGSRPNPTKS
jgi:hypothetical protein